MQRKLLGIINVDSDATDQSLTIYCTVKVKGQAVPLEAWTGPERSRRLRFPDFKTISTLRW